LIFYRFCNEIGIGSTIKVKPRMVAKKIEFDEVHEVEFLEDSGFFFHRLGELKISKRADAGASKFWFVVSPVHGVMFLSSDNCMCTCLTHVF